MKQWKILFLILFLCMIPSYVKAKEVADLHQVKWATPYIQIVVDQGIMAVGIDDQFHPVDRVTRAEAVQIIVKALSLPLDAKMTLKAQDISATHPEYEAFRKLVELGVLDDAQYLKPDAYVTRGQIAKMIARGFNIQVDNQNIASFRDVTAKCWAKDYIESLADVGIFHGKQHQQFAPNEPLRRGHLAKVIVQAKKFKRQLEQYEVAYDYLGKRYIMTPKENEPWVDQTITLINQYRKKENLPELVMDQKLNQLATIKVNDMIERQYFSHISPYYGQAWDLATLYDYEFVILGENLARGLTEPKEVVKAWIASVTHRENILNQFYTMTGVAVVKDTTGKYYWVQLFSSK